MSFKNKQSTKRRRRCYSMQLWTRVFICSHIYCGLFWCQKALLCGTFSF